MLFRGEVRAALGRFNPWMTEDAIRSAVERLEALPPTIEGNREMLAWLRGERQWYDEAERRHRQVRLVDSEAPAANVLHVIWDRKWGSCSTSGTVTLAADLADQPASFQDFVIAHELLHLRVPGHGRLFKALMTAHVPDWKKHDLGRPRGRYPS